MERLRKILFSVLLTNSSVFFISVYSQDLDSSRIMLYQGEKVYKLHKYLTVNKVGLKSCVLTVHRGRDVLGVSVYLSNHLLIIRFEKRFLVTDTRVLHDVNNDCLSSKHIRKLKIESIEILDWEEGDVPD